MLLCQSAFISTISDSFDESLISINDIFDGINLFWSVIFDGISIRELDDVITSYSIHYTKLYEEL